MDRADTALIDALQRDSSRPIAELAERIALSPSACHRRIRALEETGVISGYAARVDPRRIGLAVEVFVEITLTSQSREAMDRFERAVGDFDDILECHLMSGGADYLLRVAAADLDQYDAIHRDCLARLPGGFVDAFELLAAPDQAVRGLSGARKAGACVAFLPRRAGRVCALSSSVRSDPGSSMP